MKQTSWTLPFSRDVKTRKERIQGGLAATGSKRGVLTDRDMWNQGIQLPFIYQIRMSRGSDFALEHHKMQQGHNNQMSLPSKNVSAKLRNIHMPWQFFPELVLCAGRCDTLSKTYWKRKITGGNFLKGFASHCQSFTCSLDATEDINLWVWSTKKMHWIVFPIKLSWRRSSRRCAGSTSPQGILEDSVSKPCSFEDS